MKKILYMHVGSKNHGCEALVRTTVKLLGGSKEVSLWSFTKSEDDYYGVSKEVERVIESEELKRWSYPYFEALFRRKILKQSDANMKVFLRETFKNKVAVSIGGDNYCYPWSAKQVIDLNKEIRKNCRLNVLWGCSIDEEVITPEMQKDLAEYDLITAREKITYDILKEINPNTFQVADSAFLLEKEEIDLPKLFIENNTVGVNVSPLIMKYGTDDSLILKNYMNMIEYIISSTSMNICLIPHVVWDYNNDREPCQYLYDKYKMTKRISMIEDANCKQLKYVISKCKLFVGARTHATIAAYSTFVPTLVVGYSVKSKGIATDLFGTYKNYVIPVQEFKDEDKLKRNFMWLEKNKNEQKEILKKRIPVYQEEAKKAKKILDKFME